MKEENEYHLFRLRFKEIRKKRGLTQVELADELGIGQSTISQWERGVSMPEMATAKRAAMILNCSVGELLGDEDIKDAYNYEETGLIAKFRKLNELGKKQLVAHAEMMIASGMYAKE